MAKNAGGGIVPILTGLVVVLSLAALGEGAYIATKSSSTGSSSNQTTQTTQTSQTSTQGNTDQSGSAITFDHSVGQQQGNMPLPLISPTPTMGPVNKLVDCGYAGSGGQCIASVPRTCIDWRESGVLAKFQAPGADKILRVWYGDEHALTLGKGSTVSPFAPIPGSLAGHIVNPNTGDSNALDPSQRPLRPALFITDITNKPGDRSGDWEYGGQPFDPTEIFGTWKETNTHDPAANDRDLGPGSSPLPAGISEDYVSEIRWNMSDPKYKLVAGHTYRLEFMVHDGDNTKDGGDAGEKCASIQF